MKKILGLLLVPAWLAGSVLPVMAQPLEAGVKGGVNFTNISMDPHEIDTHAKGEPLAGGFVAYRFHDRVALAAEVLYAKVAVTASVLGADARIDARALLVPVPVEIALGSVERTHLFVSGGVQWTFLGETTETVNGVETVDETRDWDVGPLLGGGVRIPLRRGALGFEARYVWGLRDQDRDEDTVKLRTLLFLASYRF